VRTLIRPALVVGIGLVISACGDSGSESKRENAGAQSDFSPVLAQVGDYEITRGYFDYCYENLSPMDKARFSGEGWEQRFLDYLVEQEVIAQAAEAENLDMVRENEWTLHITRQNILYTAFNAKHFGDNVVVPEEEIVDVYEADPEAYRNRGRMRAQHIQCSSKEKIDQAWAELQAGEHWSRVCPKYTEDENTIEQNGSLGWFNPDGYVIGMGFAPEFTEVAFSIEEHTTAPPVKIGDNWHIIRTGGKMPGEIQPLEAVRERIARALRPGLAREMFETRLRELKQEADVRYFGEFASIEQRSAEALYRLAAETRDPHAKVDYYGKVVEMYPDHELADEALFMQGFVYSEEFGDSGSAGRCFRRLARDYPESEFVDEAKWMLGNLARAVPSLRGDQLPSTAEEANQRIRDAGN
jgi:tetratricopeptide (TPR) repeat protein